MVHYSWEAILAHVARKLAEATETDIGPEDLVPPPDPDLGDIAFGCFKPAKALGKPPVDIAKLVEGKLAKGDHTIASVKATGPYVNVTLKAGDLISRVIHDVVRSKGSFGRGDAGDGRVLLLEYAQPNTHKEVHIGHLRNVLIGSSLEHVLRQSGWDVVPVSYHGDVGAHVAKCLWFLVRMQAHLVPKPAPAKKAKGKKKADEAAAPDLAPEAWAEHVLGAFDEPMADLVLHAIPREDRTGRYLGQLYAESTKLLEENPEWKSQVSLVQQRLEAQAPGWYQLWLETKRWSVDEMTDIFQELGAKFARSYFESEVVADGQRMVDDLLARGIARVSEGAVIVDLEEEKLGTFVVRKSDGTSLYATKDLALAVKKSQDFPLAKRSLHVVDARQSLYFKQLFRTLGHMGYALPLEFVGHEVVTLTTGAMSSRQGNVVTWESFRDEVVAYAEAETAKRHEDWVEGRVKHTAWCLAMGGIKFGMLKQDGDKIFTFDLARALSFDGDTGPYAQYAATRLAAILRKAEWDPKTGYDAADPVVLHEPAEKRLALHVAAYPAVCRKAAEELRPALIAQWCITMAARVNELYRDVNVLGSEGDVRAARLQLVAVAHVVLAQALGMLGIPLPDEM